MKFLQYFTVLVLASLVFFTQGCSNAEEKKEPGKVVMKTLDVKGMTCEGCEATIVDRVTKLDGVVSSKASHVKESVIVKYDDGLTDINTIMKTISSIGYKVNGIKKEEAPKE